MVFQDEGSSSLTCTASSQHQPKTLNWLQNLRSDERGLYLIHLLATCATSVAAGAIDQANSCLEHIALLASPNGDAMQRIASHFTEALALRLLRHWPGLYRAIHSSSAVSPDAAAAHLLARKHFSDFFPFLKFAFLAANYAILHAMHGERVVHVIDLAGASADAAQWVALMHAFKYRAEGPPHLRITVVSDNRIAVDEANARLCQEAETLDIPFQFSSVISKLDDLDFDRLRIKTGEAVAINSLLQLHYLLASDEKSTSSAIQKNYTEQLSTCSSSSLNSPSTKKMDSFLSSVWGLSPKVVVVVEQEANHNGLTLMERFSEALNYYAAVFDCMQSSKAGEVERERMERVIFGEEIKNIIACEGVERRERHERAEKWAERMENSGFTMVNMSYYGGMVVQCRRLLQGCSDGYRVGEHKGCLFLCWHDRPLYSVSAWSCNRF